MAAQPLPRITPEQYLEAERKADFRSEYHGGEVYAMSGGTYPHAKIILNVGAELRQALKGSTCTTCTSEIRLRISRAALYTYPDVIVVSGDAQFDDDQNDTILNPTLIVEVLSKSTEAYDRGGKFAQYRMLESLQEYVLVSQYEPRVEKFRRRDAGEWLMTEYVGLEAVCKFESVACPIPLSEVYYNVTFTPEPETMA